MFHLCWMFFPHCPKCCSNSLWLFIVWYESIIEKIYQHFHIYPLHDEVLLSFGKLKETGSTDILGHGNAWRLLPLAAVETTTDVMFFLPWKPVSFHLNSVPLYTKVFFENPLAITTPHFLAMQLRVFSYAIHNIEKKSTENLNISLHLLCKIS